MIASFGRDDGLPDQDVGKIIEDHQGNIYTTTAAGGFVQIVKGRAVVVAGSQAPPFRGATGLLQDSRGDWWIGSNKGAFLFPGPELQLRHGKRFTAADGFDGPAESIGDIYEDPRGRLWISAGEGLYYSDSARIGRAVFERLPLDAIHPAGPSVLITWMTSDRSGALWLGARFGLLAMFKDGSVRLLQPTTGLPETDVRALFVDSRGWLWIGLRSRGVSMTRDPGAEHPEFVNYSTESGLASEYVLSIAEDDFGRIYLGTFKGLDRLDPNTGEIRHLTTTDGLAGNVIGDCIKDRAGNIWIATRTGLSVLNPRAERVARQAPAVYLSRIQLAGEDLPLAETGVARLASLELPASRNNLLIEYVGLSFQGEQQLRYQYQLEGADADWSMPSEHRSVNYARLAGGSYRFQVRAINQQGLASEPALFEFRILPPLWQRWWFLSAVAFLIGLIGYATYRYRLAQLIELERVRTRIATDLHDDIGSSLSRMAILSEVVKRQIHGASSESMPQSVPLLTEIADTARGLVDGMGDIVWSIDPRRDDLSSLVSRIRHFASDVLEAKGIAWDFQVPSNIEKVKLTPEQRRHIYLIFKEALNNIVRHAGCSSVSLSFVIDDHQVVADICDDGQGFDYAEQKERVGGRAGERAGGRASGQGLRNMHMRAGQLGGRLEIDSAPGKGTHVKLLVPLKRRLA